MKIYLAGPLFSEAKQAWHRATKARIEADTAHSVIWPLDLFRPGEVVSWGSGAAARVMVRCKDALAECGLVVALLDGPQVDDGTAWEIGFAFARDIPVIGIRTDFRQAGDVDGALVNSMIHASCRVIVRSVDELVKVLR